MREDWSKTVDVSPRGTSAVPMFIFIRGIRILSALGLAALITLGVAHAQGKEPIKIGWLSSLTGPLSSVAIAENKGVEFAGVRTRKKP